jgi:hypothetical protein
MGTHTDNTATALALAGITKAEVIARIVANGIASKTWRSSTETEALGCLAKNERTTRKGDVLAFVKTEYDAAGAGYSGRWQ